MSSPSSIRAVNVLRILILVCGAIFVGLWVTVFLLRVGYPFDLEWMEGGTVEEVRRILAGQPVYVAPTIEFVPYIYNPLYFYLSAGVAKVTGLGYAPLRAVSFASSLGAALVLFALVRRETRSLFAGALSACLFAATYRLSGTWFDLARVDALFLFLLLCAVLALRAASSLRAHVLAGLLLYLAFMAKQTAMIVAPPLMLYAILARGRRGWAFVACAIVPALATVAALDVFSGGWYTYYAFKLAGRHPLLPEAIASFWLRDVLAVLGVASAFGAFYLLGAWRQGGGDAVRFHGLFAVGMFTAAFYSRIHDGGAENVLMPAHASLAILFGLGVQHAVERSRARGDGAWREPAIYAACLLQFALLAYNPVPAVPTRRDLEAGWALVRSLSAMDGDVLVDSRPTLATMAGKKSIAHGTAMKDVLLDRSDPLCKVLEDSLFQAIASRRFAAIVISDDDLIPPEFVKLHYSRVGNVFPEPDVFWPVVGFQTRPELVFFR